MKKTVKLISIILGLGLIMIGCSSNATKKESNTLKVGVIATISGSGKFYGDDAISGVNLAVQQINSAGGIGGKNIELIIKDDQGNTNIAVDVAKQMKNDNIIAVIGPVFSSNCIAVAPIFQEAKIPMLTPTGTNYAVTQAGDYISRACFTDNFQGNIMAKFAVENLKAKTVVIMIDTGSGYSKVLVENFESNFISKGGVIKSKISYDGKQTNYSEQLQQIKNDNPDVIFLPGYAEVKVIVKQARELGINSVFLGGDGWDSNSIIDGTGNALDGSYFCTHYFPIESNTKIANFINDYKAKYGKLPSVIAALSYDSVQMIVEAIKKSETLDDKEKIKNAINSLKNLKLVTGNLSMDNNRNPIKDGFIIKIENGQFKYNTTVNFE